MGSPRRKSSVGEQVPPLGPPGAPTRRRRHIPVVVLTTSSHEADVLKSYKLRCSSYIVKPVDFDQFAEVIREVTEYWFTIVVLPKLD